jgi:hypothetical protein
MARGCAARYRYDMALTRADFLRLLPFAAHGPWRVDGDRLEGATDGVSWSLRIVEGPERRIALLALPTLDVTLDCAADSDDRIERFHERFLLAFQRGGG